MNIMRTHHINLTTLAALCISTLSACGGGGGNSPHLELTPTSITPVSVEQNRDASLNQEQELPDSKEPISFISTELPYQVTINGHTHVDKRQIVLYDFKENTLSEIPTQSGSIRAYRQQHSIIAGYLAPQTIVGKDSKNEDITIREPMSIGLVKGDITSVLPDEGQYQYTGQAFSDDESGRFNYKVDFNRRKGSGSITGIEKTGMVMLQEADIKNIVYDNSLDDSHIIAKGIEGKTLSETQVRGDYSLTFFGSEAKEIGGIVYQPSIQIGVGGVAR